MGLEWVGVSVLRERSWRRGVGLCGIGLSSYSLEPHLVGLRVAGQVPV